MKTEHLEEPYPATRQTTVRTRAQAEASGYAVFNDNPHICLTVNEQTTITVNTPKGQVTFAFMPYTKGGAPNCVDIKCHNEEEQKIIAFNKGSDHLHFSKLRKEGKKPVTLTCVVIDEEP